MPADSETVLFARLSAATRNRSEWQGASAEFTYQGWTEAGAGLDSWTDTATGSHELFPARMQNVSAIPPSGYNTLLGRLRVETNTSCAHGLALLFGTDWIIAESCQIRNVAPWGMEFVHADDFSVTYQLAREELIPRVNITSHGFISDKLAVSFNVTDLLGVINTAAIQVVNSNGVGMDIEVNLTPDAGNPPGGPFVSRFEANYDTSIPPDWFSEGENWVRVVAINSAGIYGWDELLVVMEDGEVESEDVYDEPNNYDRFYDDYQPQLYCAQFTLPVPIPILGDEMPVILTAYDSDENVFHQREMALHKVSDFIYRSAPFHHGACDIVSSPPALAAQVPVLLTPSSPEGGETTKSELPPGYAKLIARKRKVWAAEVEKYKQRKVSEAVEYMLHGILQIPKDDGSSYEQDFFDESSYFLPGYSRSGKQQMTFTRGQDNILVVTTQKLRLGVELTKKAGEYGEFEDFEKIKKVRFTLDDASSEPGYCTNLDNFGQASDNGLDFVITEMAENPPRQKTVDVDVIGAGEYERKRAFVTLECRDFGGWCRIKIQYLDINGNSLTPHREWEVRYPSQPSHISDRIAWTWVDSQESAWKAQYGAPFPTEKQMGEFGMMGWDGELPDPDGGGPLAAHASVAAAPYNNPAKNANDDFGTGDGFTAFEEYRGFVGACNGTDKYAHRRLSAARKEVLIEIDVMAAKTVPEGAVTQVQNTDGDKDTLWVGDETWRAGILRDLDGLWVNPNIDDTRNNNQSLLISQAYKNALDVYQTVNGDLKECVVFPDQQNPTGSTLRIHSHQPPSLAELTDTAEANKGIMTIVEGLFLNTAGIQIYYIIDEQNANHKVYNQLNNNFARKSYALAHRQAFRNAAEEDYRRFMHLIFVDSMLEDDPYQLHGEAYSTINLDDWKPLPAQDKPAAGPNTPASEHPGSNEHYVMVGVSPMRNYGNAAKTYLGTTDNMAQRKMIAAIVAHEMGHAIRIDGHTTTSLETVFELQSKITNDKLYLHPNEITHPCRIETDFPLYWKFWDATYDTIGEIFTALPPEKYNSKRWVKPAATTWPALDLKETAEYIKPDGGAQWTQIRAYDSQWTMCSPVSPRVAKDLLGFIQTADSGTPYISVKYHFGAPKYKYGAP